MMIDSHCHLDLPQFEGNLQDVMQRANAVGVSRILIPGTTPTGWLRQTYLARNMTALVKIDYAFGIHPYFLNQVDQQYALSALEQQFNNNPDAVALGEIGIDGHIDAAIPTQQRLFEQQLQLAQQLNLPVILHHRKSHHLLLASLKRCQFKGKGVIHAFSGSVDIAKRYLDLGLTLGIGGTITYPRGSKTRNALNALYKMYSSQFLLETDGPDMPMYGRQGGVNEPSFLGDVVTAFADCVGVNEQNIINHTTQNYRSLFLTA